MNYYHFFKKDIRTILIILTLLGAVGCLLDLFLFPFHEKNITIVNYATVALLLFVFMSVILRLFTLQVLLFIAIYTLVANIIGSQLLTTYMTDFATWYFRETIFIALLIVLAAVGLGKFHAFLIAFIYFIYSLYVAFICHNLVVMGNLPVTLTVVMCFAIVISYFAKKLRDTLTELHEKNITIEKQKESLEVSHITIEESKVQLEENLSELQSMADTISETNDLLSQQNVMLKELNMMKDKFFSIIAHDLKGPMSSILVLLENTLNKFDKIPDETKHTQMTIIARSTNNLYLLLENLLVWSRSQTHSIELQFETLGLGKMVKQICNLLNTLANNKNIEVRLHIHPEVTIWADKMTIETVFRNLLSNAIKFTNAGGQIEINAVVADNTVEICVADNGVGIAECNLLKLFKIGEKLSAKGTAGESGTGLGLILCQEFVEKNRGTIRVESTVGVGTKFFVTLPLV